MSAFVRVEARFDCIYYHGCGIIRSAETFGNDATGRDLPRRLNDAIELTEPIGYPDFAACLPSANGMRSSLASGTRSDSAYPIGSSRRMRRAGLRGSFVRVSRVELE